MVTPSILEKHGCTPEKWKPLFTADSAKKLREIKRLELLIQNRLTDGRMKNLAEYRTYAAIDLAYDASFGQTTPTIIQSILGRPWNGEKKYEEMMAAMEQWGLNTEELFLKTELPNGQCGWTFNPPTFYKMLIPLVKAYVTTRWAKLFNDRNQTPLLKYEPLEPNEENRILCEVLTYMIEVISADYGYANVLKDAIFQTLNYSVCLAFPREVWHYEEQLEEVDGKEKKVVQKEGIRYELPHPTRMFWDLNYPINTFNTGTGCRFAGYWKIVPYGDLLDNPDYWNRRAIGYSARGDWLSPEFSSNFFPEVYPCRLEFPTPAMTGADSNRENNASFYSTNERDKAVFQSDLFMKINPRKYKMGTYPYDIWVRFVVASDNTVLYAEPCCYDPVIYMGYDANSLRSRTSSMSLEVIPFQDVVGNLLSQILLTVKQNLANVIFYDTQSIDARDVGKIKNSGELYLRSLNFIPFDGRKAAIAGIDMKSAINQVAFNYKDVQPLFQSLNTVLSLLERLLQLSAQETGAAASHQQSAEELRQVGASTSNRVKFTGTYIDDFIDAWKRQQHDAAMAYMDDPIEAMVPSDIPDIEEHLKLLGFEVGGKFKGEGRLKVKGSKKFIKLDSLSASGTGPERKNDSQTAQVMMQAVGAIAGNAELMKALGVKPLLKIIEKAAILAGADKDFKVRPDQKQEMENLQAMAEQIMIAAAKKAEDDISKPVAQNIAKMQKEIQTLDQALANLIKQIQPQQPNANPNPTPPPVGGAPPAVAQPPVA